MESRNIYANLSPIDHRYYSSNREHFDALARYLSEEAAIRYSVIVESALLKTHAQYQEHLQVSPEIFNELEKKITSEEVYREEEETKHNIRALVNVIKRYLPEDLRPFVHLGATSVDILDTAFALRIRDSLREVVIPLLLDVEEELVRIVTTYSDSPQVGRTHGQHAVPITLGFAFAEYVSRLGKSIQRLQTKTDDLRGKLAGAVGAYNATSLMVKDPEDMERTFLAFLNLKPSEHSTQLVEPEYLLQVLLEMNTAFGIIANCADDLRNLQRTEIAEVREYFSSKQVGSSTMPQKRNPWNSEHIKSLWKAFAPRVMTFFMDQISEHQRDLTNSASQRFIVDYCAGFTAAAARLKKVLKGLTVDSERCSANLTTSGSMVLAEPVYILLAVSGDLDAHETVRKITLACEKNGRSLGDELQEHEEIWEKIDIKLKETVGISAMDFFSSPRLYRGRAVEKSKSLASKYGEICKEMRGKTHGNS